MKNFLRKLEAKTGISLHKRSKRFWIGVILLTTNQPFGWGGMLLFNFLAVKYHSVVYSYLGFGIYGLSWGILALGGILAGPEGKKLFKELLRLLKRKIWKKKNNNNIEKT